jgi:hypothetical protein
MKTDERKPTPMGALPCGHRKQLENCWQQKQSPVGKERREQEKSQILKRAQNKM